MPDLIVFTCASGKQCSQIIPSFYREPLLFKLRLVVHSSQSLERMQKTYPNAEVIQANLDNLEDCSNIVRNATTIYYVCPLFQPQETQYGINVIDAAMNEYARRGSKFAHFVFSSVAHPEIRKLLNHTRKLDIEEFLTESGLPYTILQPSHFAENAIHRLLEQRHSPNPVFMAAHSPHVAFSFSCLRDHAEASVKVIKEGSRHYYATYQLVSTLPMKYTDYVKSIAEVMGTQVEIKQIPYTNIVETLCQTIFGEEKAHIQALRDAPERLMLYYNARGIVGNPNVLEWLLGRPGTSPVELARILINEASHKTE